MLRRGCWGGERGRERERERERMIISIISSWLGGDFVFVCFDGMRKRRRIGRGRGRRGVGPFRSTSRDF